MLTFLSSLWPLMWKSTHNREVAKLEGLLDDVVKRILWKERSDGT